MAFKALTKGEGKRQKTTNRVAIRSYGNGQTILMISADVYAAIGAPKYMQVFVGTDTDEGTILLTPAATAKHAYTVHGSGAQKAVTLTTSAIGAPKTGKVTACAFVITPNGALHVEMPAERLPATFSADFTAAQQSAHAA